MFSRVAVPFYGPTSRVGRFQFPHFLEFLSVFLKIAVPAGVKWRLMVLNSISLMAKDSGRIFTYGVICITSLENCPLRSFARFLWVVFLLLCCKNSLYILDKSLLHMICRYLLPFLRLTFHFLDGISESTKVLNF